MELQDILNNINEYNTIKVKHFLDNNLEEVRLFKLPTNELIKFLNKLGFVYDGDSYEANGWEPDWQCKFEKDKKNYILGGSGYYGNTVGLYYNED